MLTKLLDVYNVYYQQILSTILMLKLIIMVALRIVLLDNITTNWIIDAHLVFGHARPVEVQLVLIVSLVDYLQIQEIHYHLKDIWMISCVQKLVNLAIIQKLIQTMEILARCVNKHVKLVLEEIQTIVVLVFLEHF